MKKSEHLTPLDVLIYNRIKWLTENGKYKHCTMGNKSLGEYFGRPKESISRTISKLKKLGYIREEKDGTLRKLYSTDKENIYNYGVIGSDKTVISNDETVIYDDKTVNVDDKVVMLKSLLNDEVVIRAMTKSLSNDDEVVKHNIRLNIRYIIKDLNIKEKTSFENEFEEFWSLYPRKLERKKSEIRFVNILKNKEATFEEIIKGLKNYIAYLEQENTEKCYIKHSLTWLNGACWQNEYEIKEENEFLRGL